MRAGRPMVVATLFSVGVLGWAVLIPSLPAPSSVLHAAAGDDERRGSRSNGRADDRSNGRSDDRSDGRSDDHRGGRGDDDRGDGHPDGGLDAELRSVLRKARFTGKIESTLEARLGRRLNAKLADLGRLLWFDKIHSLGRDNTCAGCHSPTNGFGDTQSIAIGVQNNNKVGHIAPDRAISAARRWSSIRCSFRKLMWNGRFCAPSDDPFDNSRVSCFPRRKATRCSRRTIRSSNTLLSGSGAHSTHRARRGGRIHWDMPDTRLQISVSSTMGRAIRFRTGRFGFRNEPIRQSALELSE